MIKPVAEKIILGIDPGTNVMGYGVIKVEGTKASIVTMGVIDMRKESDMYLKLGHIFQRVNGIIDSYLPDEMAIEERAVHAQAWTRPGRCNCRRHQPQRANHGVRPHEDQNGNHRHRNRQQRASSRNAATHAAPERERYAQVPGCDRCPYALAAAYCHYLQMGRPDTGKKGPKSWKEFIASNPGKVSKRKTE